MGECSVTASEGELRGCSTELRGNTFVGSLHWELSHYQLYHWEQGLLGRILFHTQCLLTLLLAPLQPWIICVGVSQTARSSPTCPMATWQTFRGPILLSLLHLPPTPLPSLRHLGQHLQPLPLLQRGNPSQFSRQERVSSVPLPTLLSRQLPLQGWWSRPKSRHLRSLKFSWSLMNHNRSGKRKCCSYIIRVVSFICCCRHCFYVPAI